MTSTDTEPQLLPTIRRVRHEAMRRSLEVTGIERITPAMIRVTLRGDEMASFASASPDDHIKVFIPGPDGADTNRDYTPRRFDVAKRELVIDFVDHDAGPAALWARAAKIGDTLMVGGPRGSAAIEGEAIAAWLLIGDETALPAIGRRVEELPPGTPVTTLVAVEAPQEEQVFATAAALDARWIHRPMAAATDPAPFIDALRTITVAPNTFVWAAAEAGVARAIRTHLLEQRGHPKPWLKAAGYWIDGTADTSIKTIEDPA